MNIHEYQGKALLKSYGAPVADGVAIFSADEAAAAAAKLPGPLYVVKSQVKRRGSCSTISPATARANARHTDQSCVGWIGTTM